VVDHPFHHVGQHIGDGRVGRAVGSGEVLLQDVAVLAGDLVDEMRLDVGALVGDRRIGGGHLHRHDVRGAQRDARIVGQRRADAEALCEVDHPLAGHQVPQLDRGDVDRLLQGAAQGHDPIVLVVVVLRPVAQLAVAAHERRRRVEQRVGRRPPLLERRAVDERLERRAHLAPGLGDAVELVAVEVPAAHHRPHGAGLALQDHRRRLDDRLLLQEKERLARFCRCFCRRFGGLGVLLRLRRVHAEPAHHAPLEDLARRLAVRPGDPLGVERQHLVADLDPRRGAGFEDDALIPPFEHRLAVRPGGELLRVDVFLVDRGDGAAEAAAVVEAQELVADGVLGGTLDLRIERRLHLEAILIERRRAVFGFQVLADVLGEVGGEHLLRLLRRHEERL